MLAGVQLAAQEATPEVEYRLRVPTAEEYLDAVPELLSQMEIYQRRVLEVELATRYPEMLWLDFERVEQVYAAFLSFAGSSSALTQGFWTPTRIVSWLTTNNIELDDNQTLTFENAQISVTADDINADGQQEWILNYTSDSLRGVLFVELNSAGRYIAIENVMTFEEQHGYTFTGERADFPRFQVLATEDFTQDGIADIAILYTDDDGNSSGERLHILSWRDNALVDLSDDTLSIIYQSLTPIWEFLDFDDDGNPEIRQIRELRDNWDCYYTRTTIYDWDGESITSVQEVDEFPDSPRCTLRFAEEAMWSHDFDEAISLYRNYLDFDQYPQQYAQFRLAIALILNDQVEQGITLLRQLQTEQAGKTSYTLLPLANQLILAYEENPTPVSVCLAAYDYFAFNAYDVWGNEVLEVGYTIDNMIYEQGMHSPGAPSPANAGCDLPALLNELLSGTEFTTESIPLRQLEALGIVSDITYQDDLNQDGIQDWLVWLPTIRISPVFFLSNGNSFVVSRLGISDGYPLNEQNSLLTVHLPDDSAVALLNVDYSEHYQPPPLGYGLGGGPGNCPASGNLDIWQLTKTELTLLSHLTQQAG
jgi:hypothetical protein